MKKGASTPGPRIGARRPPPTRQGGGLLGVSGALALLYPPRMLTRSLVGIPVQGLPPSFLSMQPVRTGPFLTGDPPSGVDRIGPRAAQGPAAHHQPLRATQLTARTATAAHLRRRETRLGLSHPYSAISTTRETAPLPWDTTTETMAPTLPVGAQRQRDGGRR